jgi:hypothetical protein
MIPWFQCTAFELKAISDLPTKLRKRFVAARELQLFRELETLPGFTESELLELESIGIATKLEIMCPRLLKERDRQVRKKTREDEFQTRVEHGSVTGDTRAQPAQSRVEKSREEEKKKGERAPRAPKQPPKGRRALDAFNAAVTEVTGSPSTTMGISMERKAAAMQEAIDAAGETWTQAVKRRHDLGKSLNLHWMANDYASDRTMRQRPGITRPNLSNNLLQTDHPDGAGEEYWLQGIEKYKYGGTNG